MEFLIFLIGGLWLLIKCSSESAAKSHFEKVTSESREKQKEFEKTHLPDYRTAQKLDDIARKRVEYLPQRVQEAIAEIKKACPDYIIGPYEKGWLVYAMNGYCKCLNNVWHVFTHDDIYAGRLETLRQVEKMLNENGVHDVKFVKRTGSYEKGEILVEAYGMMEPFIRDFGPLED